MDTLQYRLTLLLVYYLYPIFVHQNFVCDMVGIKYKLSHFQYIYI